MHDFTLYDIVKNDVEKLPIYGALCVCLFVCPLKTRERVWDDCLLIIRLAPGRPRKDSYAQNVESRGEGIKKYFLWEGLSIIYGC